jgi:flavin reductase (DIM6/NTAB) family NADH-FMN oxidoreductase RutF
MFYEPSKGHGLPRDPFKALVAPRPIGWFTTLNDDGSVNVGPYSYFNAVADDPPVVMFAASPRGPDRVKDSARNALARGEFVHNMVTYELREQMNATSEEVPPGIEEAALAGLDLVPSRLVRPPRIAASPVALECRTVQLLEIPQNGGGGPTRVVLGEVIGVHIDDRALEDGRVELGRLRPIARLGYANYAVVDTIFRMVRPGVGGG